MKKLVLPGLVALFFACAAVAQSPTKPPYYTISFPNAAHHEAEIVLTIPKATEGILSLRMSRSSAGRYATHEFGKNIYNLKAFNTDGSKLDIKQVEGDRFEI